MFIHMPDCSHKLFSIAVQPVCIMHRWVGRLQTKGKDSPVCKRIDQCLRYLLRWFQILGYNRRICIIDMKHLDSLIITYLMQNLRNGLRVWNGVLKIYHSFSLVGIHICGPSNPNIPYACISRRFYLCYDVLLISPERHPFLGLYAELAPPLVPHTALVQFNLIGEWSGASIGGYDIWMIGHRSGRCSPKCPS